MKKILLLILFPVLCISGCNFNESLLESPNGRIQVLLQAEDKENFTWSLIKDGEMMISPSGFLLSFLEQEDFGKELMVDLMETTVLDDHWEPLWGKSSVARNHCHQYTYRLSESGDAGRFLDWVLRIYDDGVAFRYVFPEESGFGHFKLTEEASSFYLDPSHRAWATNHYDYYSSQEHTYDEKLLREIGEEELIGCPLLVEAEDAGWLLLTEANLTDWAGLYFKASGENPGTMVSSLASLKRDSALKVEGSCPAKSPWRVVMVGDDPGDLIESNLIANLNEPAEYEDVSWIKPGLSAWDRWWSGDYAPDAGFEPGMNTATMKYFIDLAYEMGWDYQIVDWTWYGTVFDDQGPTSDADITTPIEEVDIEGIIQYAAEKNVKIILWVLSDHLDRQMDEALALYEKWGAAGIKVDFMDCDDQDMVNWYHKLARKAAEHHLVIDFHGAYKPTGVSRTLPNMLTREGVLGNEYTKWSDQITPRHTVVLPFTRGLLGEMDFTPGGFNHIHQEDFVITDGGAPNPAVMGTRCHQLAMLVVFESVFGVICDSPYNYKDQPGSDFLKLVPSTWDETRYISGYPGESIVIARRYGNQWFIGGMSNEISREITLSLDFLGEGKRSAVLWKDGEDADLHPAHLQKEQFEVSAEKILTLRLAHGGGFVLVID